MIVALGGELDLEGSGLLASELRHVMSPNLDTLEIDAGELSFTDSAGLLAVLAARHEAETRGMAFQVTAVSPPVERMIQLAGLNELLPAQQR